MPSPDQEPSQELSAAEAVALYFERSGTTVDAINPDSLKLQFAFCDGSIYDDAKNVLGVAGDEVRCSREELAFNLGVVVGAALQKRESLPERFENTVDRVAVTPKPKAAMRAAASRRPAPGEENVTVSVRPSPSRIPTPSMKPPKRVNRATRG